MKSVLVITPSATQLLPTQGLLIAERLRQAGVQTCVLGKAKSRWGRLLEIPFRSCMLARRYDAVLVNVYGEWAFVYESLAILYARLWKKRIVVLIRSGLMPEFVRRRPRWARLVLSQANLVLVPHGFLQEKLSGLGLRIDGVIPNFIDLKRYKFRQRSGLAPRFLHLRGMYPYYNPQMAIRAFSLIQSKYPDALQDRRERNQPSAEPLFKILTFVMSTFLGKSLKSRFQYWQTGMIFIYTQTAWKTCLLQL